MKASEGQKHITSLFVKGIDRDSDPDLLSLSQDHATLRDVQHLRRKIDGTYVRMDADAEIYGSGEGRAADGNQRCLFLQEINGYIVEIWYDQGSPYYTTIWVDGQKVGESTDLPGDTTNWPDVAVDVEGGDIYITDNNTFPMVFNIQDMVDNLATTKYKDDFDANNYRLQLTTHIDQPVFVRHESVGTGGGLNPGSYSYSIRYVDTDGNKTNWSPSTPMIPVYENIDLEKDEAFPAMFSVGAEPSTSGTKYGIIIRFRVTNEAGYDHIEIKRVANTSGLTGAYTANHEYIILTHDANGNEIDVNKVDYGIVDFLDRGGLAWLTLDEEALEESVPIAKAKTIRFYDGHIILGGVTYEERDFTTPNGLILEDSESEGIQPVNIDLGLTGFKNPYAQVYRKSYMRGERYGFAFQLVDEFGGVTFANPFDNYKNFQFPGRRDILTGNSESISNQFTSETPQYATINSDDTTEVDRTFEAFSFKERSQPDVGKPINISSHGSITYYRPFTPTNASGGYLQNSRNDDGWSGDLPTLKHDCDGSVNQYNIYNSYHNHIWSLGAAVTGFDVSKLPSWVKGVKVLRTQAAGRIIAQGIGMYAMAHSGSGVDPATKSATKMWVFAPDIDPDIGARPDLFQDMLDNPTDYQIQLVSPLGFCSGVYSAHGNVQSINDGASTYIGAVDFLSFANVYYEDSRYNNDSASEIGRGNGYVSFGRWRNVLGLAGGDDEGGDIDGNADEFLFDITAASSKHGGEFGGGIGRGSYLELTIDGSIYAYTDTLTRTDGDDGDNRRFHEPFYIVNIVKDGLNVIDNNINTYEDTGTYIKLRSTIGVGTGQDNQSYKLVDERWEDVVSQGPSTGDTDDIRYIEVNGKKWMDFAQESAGNISSWLTDLENDGYFTVDSVKYYGAYTTSRTKGGSVYQFFETTINFAYNFPVSGDAVVPGSGEKIEVIYNSNSPILVFGGDSTIGMAAFAPIDNQVPRYTQRSDMDDSDFFNLNGPMPAWEFETSPYVNFPYDYNDYELNGAKSVYLDSIRQWVVSFYCESRINLTLTYGNAFPYRHYVQRNLVYTTKDADETYQAYYDSEGIFGEQYASDYDDEYDRWQYGGFLLPFGINFDYSKNVVSRSFSRPYIGFSEKAQYIDRFHFSLSKNPGVTNSPSLRSFPPSSIYDLKRNDLGAITLLYDDISGKGRNLYAFTEKGIVLILSRKTSLTDANGAHVATIDIEGNFLQDEVWLNTSIGCPDGLQVSKSEGLIQIPDNRYVRALAFVHYAGPMLFNGNELKNIVTNWREVLEPLCRDAASEHIITGFNERWNELWVRFDTKTYVFNFFVNNWTHWTYYVYDMMTNIQSHNNVSGKRVFLGADNYRLFELPADGYDPDSLPATPTPHVIFIVNPLLHEELEFIDLLIHTNEDPDTLILDTDESFSSPWTDNAVEVRDFNPGKYLLIGRRTSGGGLGKSLQGPYLIVKIIFDETSETGHIIKAVRTGYGEMIG